MRHKTDTFFSDATLACGKPAARRAKTTEWAQVTCPECLAWLGATRPAPKPEPKREWHGCTNPAGHSFDGGVCEDCGWDIIKGAQPGGRP